MPAADYRLTVFAAERLSASAKYIGRRAFWRLYFFENTLRVLVHSVLSTQIGPTWLAAYLSPKQAQKLSDRRANYARAPHLTSPGGHDLYLLYLYEVNAILSTYRTDFLPIISDIDDWILRLEQISFSRNIVAHMNWPNSDDLRLVDTAYKEALIALENLQRKGVQILIP